MMVEKVVTAQDTITQMETLRVMTSWDETLAKQAEIKENSTINVSVTSTIGADVEKGEVTTKVNRAEDERHYLSGSKLTFLFLYVYYKFTTTRLIDPRHQRLAALYFPGYAKPTLGRCPQQRTYTPQWH